MNLQVGTKKDISRSILEGYPYLLGLQYKGFFFWDIPVLIVAYVPFWGPTSLRSDCTRVISDIA